MVPCKCCSSDKLDFSTKEVNSILRDGVINVSLRYREGYGDPIDQLTLGEAIEKVPQDYRSPLRIIQFLNNEGYNEMWTWRGLDVEKEWGDINFWVKSTDDNTIIDEVHLKDGAVTTPKIADTAVTSDKIADKSVTTEKIADKAVQASKINDGAVSTAKLADSSVTTDKIKEGSVTTPRIADGAVTTPKIADTAVTSDKIADYAVKGKKIASGAITNDKIRAGAVSIDKLNTDLQAKVNDNVKYVEQTLTAAQKAQARKNIDVDYLTEDEVANLWDTTK